MEYVYPPPKGLDTDCSVCFGPLHIDPYQNVTCGHHLCGECSRKLTKEGFSRCPECRVSLTVSPDKSLQRVLKSLEVYCSEKSEGCDWQGELGELQSHQETVCIFFKILCPFKCGIKGTREVIKEHQANDCYLRPMSCVYCSFKSTWINVTSKHYEVCQLFPLTCSCKAVVIRKDMKTHLQTTCPDVSVDCTFNELGCKWKGVRREEERHLNEKLKEHFSLSIKCNKELQNRVKKLESDVCKMQANMDEKNKDFASLLKASEESFERKLEVKYKEVFELTASTLSIAKKALEEKESEPEYSDGDTASVSSDDDEDEDDNLSVSSASSSSGFSYVLKQFGKHKKFNHICYSQPFRISSGNVMCLRVHPNGSGKGKGSFVSLYVCILKGLGPVPHFQGTITVRIRNPNPAGEHHEKDIMYNQDTPLDFIATSEKDKFGRMTSKGNGLPHFLPHKKLKKYLQNGCLVFEIASIYTC